MRKSVDPGELRGDRVWVSEIDSHWEVEGKRARKEVFYGLGAQISRTEPAAKEQNPPQKRHVPRTEQYLKGERAWMSEVHPHWVLEGKRTRKEVSYGTESPITRETSVTEQQTAIQRQSLKGRKKTVLLLPDSAVGPRNVVKGKRKRSKVSYGAPVEISRDRSTRQTSRSSSLINSSSVGGSNRAGKRRRPVDAILKEQPRRLQEAAEYPQRHQTSRRTLTEGARIGHRVDGKTRHPSCSTTDSLEGAIEVVSDWGAIEVASSGEVTKKGGFDTRELPASSGGAIGAFSSRVPWKNAGVNSEVLPPSGGLVEVLGILGDAVSTGVSERTRTAGCDAVDLYAPSGRPKTPNGEKVSRSTNFFDTVLASPPSTPIGRSTKLFNENGGGGDLSKQGHDGKTQLQTPFSSPESSLYATKAATNMVNVGQNLVDESDSSRLSTPPRSPEFSPITGQIQPVQQVRTQDSFPVVEHTRKIRGLINTTIAEANMMSNPPPGEELLRLAEEAKQRHEVPNLLDASVLRFIDGKWMAPQMCNRCQKLSHAGEQVAGTQGCNRKNPCNTCSVAGIQCEKGARMTIVYSPRSSKAAAAKRGNGSSDPDLNIYAATVFVRQSSEGIWGSEPYVRQSFQNGTWGSKPSAEIPQLDNAETKQRRTKKRKSDDRAVPLKDSPIRLHTPAEPHGAAILRPVVDGTPQSNKPLVPQNMHEVLASSSSTSSQPGPLKSGRKRKIQGTEDNQGYEPARELLAIERQETMVEGHTIPLPKVLPSPEFPAPKRRSTGGKKSGGYVKYHRSVQENKPTPYGQPPVWADKRQSLCEALPYYKAYMSGAHLHDGVVRAFMVDKEVGIRDKFDDEILIARVGGGRKLDDETGQMIQKADQSKSAIAFGFQRALEQCSPVAVIAGQGNRISPSKLPHYYNVLDWFHATDVWCEITSGLKCWMVRLEKINLHERSWWAPHDSPPMDLTVNPYDTIMTNRAMCMLCKKESKTMFNMGWTCLETSCLAYFRFDKDYHDGELDYARAFLEERTPFDFNYFGHPLEPLAPRHLTDSDIEERGWSGVEADCKAGIVCPQCRACIRRIHWSHWECETEGCDFTHRVKQTPIKASTAVADSYTLTRSICDERFGIRRGYAIRGRYNVDEYILPGENGDAVGVVMHFKADGVINGQPDGPNDLFLQMQQNDFGLKRHPARQKDSTGEILTSHWAANWGAPYKYGVSVKSKSFKEAPTVIIKALKRLSWAGKQVVTENLEPFHPFNELLSIGYFEDTAIGYHDDGESTLGPTVATLSLGASAIMSLRPKAKARLGPISKNAKGTKLDVLKFVLNHGDLVVMHGRGVQKYYEHAVTPQGKLRFALTCRYVDPETLSSDAERADAAAKSDLPTGHEAFAYESSMDQKLSQVEDENSQVAETQSALNSLIARAITGELSGQEMQYAVDSLAAIVAVRPKFDEEMCG